MQKLIVTMFLEMKLKFKDRENDYRAVRKCSRIVYFMRKHDVSWTSSERNENFNSFVK